MYSQAIEETGFDYETLRHDVALCGRIELGRRRPNLSFGHHNEIAYLEPEQQKKWLDRAEKEDLTVAELGTQVTRLLTYAYIQYY